MASKTTRSSSYKYLTEYYSTSSLPFQIKNHGPGVAKVKVVEIFSDEFTLSPSECVTHSVAGFARVDFKSRDGDEVTVESIPGECPRPAPGGSSELPATDLNAPELEELNEAEKDLIRKVTQAQRSKLKWRLED